MIPARSAPGLRRFLTEYIVTERNLARNTQKSYRDTFALLLPFVGARARKPVERIAVQDLTARHVRQFLDYLEDDRGCSVQTRNQRLSAIRAFARFIASRDPGPIEWSGSIRAIASKKAAPKPIGWLSKTEMKDLLEAPDRRTPRGRVEHALLLFLYNTGARVSETTQLVAGDLQIGRRGGGQALVNIHGKGGKHRQCPLWPRTEAALTELLQGRAAGGCRLPQPAAKSLYSVRSLSARRALCGPRTVARRKEDYASHNPSHERLPPAPGRHRSEHDPRLARSCQPRYYQHLRRDRHGDEGQGHGALRCRRVRIGSPVESKHGTDRLPGRALSEGDYVAEIRRVLMCSRMIRTVRHIIRTATYSVAIDRRSIPAWAGNTLEDPLFQVWVPVHPRVGGEHYLFPKGMRFGDGPSPRRRGTPEPPHWRPLRLRSIPA